MAVSYSDLRKLPTPVLDRVRAGLRAVAVAQILLLGGCALLERETAQPEVTPADAPPATAQWMETDAVVSIDNLALAGNVETTLQSAPLPADLTFSTVKAGARDGAMALTIEGRIQQADRSYQPVFLSGRIEFSYSGHGLAWRPTIESLSGPGLGGETLLDEWLESINAALTRHVVIEGRNNLGLRLQPPATVKLEGGLPGLGLERQARTFTLDGAYAVAASLSRTLADKTQFALDLEYVEGVSHCESDFSISRSAFAGEIRNREPRNLAIQVPATAPQWHYFTEVSDARRSLTLVHYWFADGRAVGITELAVEPSARWRTWSTLPVVPGTVRHIEVFAADRDTGCIVSGAHIEVAPGEEQAAARFASATQSFTATQPRQGMATVALSRTAVAETVNDALGGARFALRFDKTVALAQSLSGSFEVRNSTTLQCIRPDCTVQTECAVDFSRCQRLQDTRECTTCLFRNPLNNRCMSERSDAACEARKAGLNDRYAREWQACMAKEESAQATCERRGQEAVEVCEARAEQFSQTCAANQQALQGHSGPLADIAGESRAEGTLAIAFTELEVSGDMTALKGLASLVPDLRVEGTLAFTPANGLGSLGECIDQWDAPFQTNFARPQAARRLAGPLRISDGTLAAAWPGLTMPVAMNRGPVEAFLMDDPWRLAACMPGLTAADAGAQVSGEAGLFLRGILAVDVAEARAQIALPTVSMGPGEADNTTLPVPDGQQYRYELILDGE